MCRFDPYAVNARPCKSLRKNLRDLEFLSTRLAIWLQLLRGRRRDFFIAGIPKFVSNYVAELL